MKSTHFLGLIILACSLAGCSNGALSPADLIRWVESPENGLITSQVTGDVIHEALFRPVDYMIALEEKTPELAASRVADRREELAGMQYFRYRMQGTSGEPDVLAINLEDQSEYQRRVAYLSFDLQRDIRLVEGQDTLDCHLFHFERRYGITPFVDIILGFDQTGNEQTQDKQLLIRNLLTGSEPIRLTIPGKAIDDIPNLHTH